MPEKFIWTSESKTKYENILQSDQEWFCEKIHSLADNLDKFSIDQTVEQLTFNLKLACEKSGIKKRKLKMKDHAQKSNKPWFDKECDIMKQGLKVLAEKLKQNPKDINIREQLNTEKKIFKKLNKMKRNMYKTQIVNQMNENYFNPKTFWALLNKLKPSKAADNAHIKSISPKQWLNHFGTLLFNNDSDTQDHLIHDDPDSFLNAPVSKDEINLVLKKLKNRKAAGLDQLSNEMIKTFGSLYTEFLSKLFSKILHEHKFPTLWITGLLLPVHKKGPKSLVKNYRGIMLLSCLGKLFTAILNERLLTFANENNTFAKEQIGFLKGNRTSDNLIILHNLIHKQLSSGEKLYTCFIDFEKAFDRVPRKCLLQKLCKNGIKGKFLKTIENMYQNDNACVRIGDKVTETFPINIGVKQGDNPSPTLFNFYLSDLPEIFNLSDTCPPLLQDGTPVGSLLWADDLVILSKTEEGLRTALKRLENYCDLNLLKINTTKSKCMIFNSRGRTIKKRFIYKSEALKVVRNYTYLGFNLSISGKINDGLFYLHQKAQKAFYKLKNQMGDMFYENVSLTIRLFDILIKPILLYASDF